MSTTFLTIQEVAQRLKVSARTIRRWIKQGYLPAFKIGKTIRIVDKDIDLLPMTHSPQRESAADIDIAAASGESFAKTWDNDEDAVYDSRRELDQKLIAGYQYLAKENRKLLEEFRAVDLEDWEEDDANDS